MKSSLAHLFLGHSTYTEKKIKKTVLSILFEKVLQPPAHLSRGAKLRDRAGITHFNPSQKTSKKQGGIEGRQRSGSRKTQ